MYCENFKDSERKISLLNYNNKYLLSFYYSLEVFLVCSGYYSI